MKKITVTIVILMVLTLGCKMEVAPDGADGAADTSSVLLDNGCGC